MFTYTWLMFFLDYHLFLGLFVSTWTRLFQEILLSLPQENCPYLGYFLLKFKKKNWNFFSCSLYKKMAEIVCLLNLM